MEQKPQTRIAGLIVRELDDEILIYDTASDRAHCLNKMAALVWRDCNGEKTVAEISKSLSRQLDSKVEDRVVWFALKQFDRDRLLEERLTLPPAFLSAGLSRREMVRVLGLTAAIAMPLVTSIVAPTPAQAATCVPAGGACQTSAECCPPGICNSGTCA